MKKILLLTAFLIALFGAANAQVVVSGDITANTTWNKSNTYLLNGFVYVTNNAILTIEPGTVIKGDKASKGTLIITRGAKLIADGTPAEPIVFTSNEAIPSYGDWGGLVLLGKAPTNQVYSGTAGLGLIEGGLDPVKGLYGAGDLSSGPASDDNSGILRYVRVEYPGIAFQPNNEINGITFGAVGSGTTVDHVQVSYSGDDAYEWFGGSVNCKHLIAYRSLDDDFDTDNGFSGNIQFALSVRDPQIADVSGSNGFESDNNAAGDATTPKTKPTFSNVTVVGPSGTPNANYKRAAHLRRNTELGVFNSLFVGNYPVGLFIDGQGAADNAANGLLEVKNTFFAGETTLLSSNITTFPIDTWFATGGWGNKTFASNDEAKLVDPFNLDNPNAQPNSGSPTAGAAAFSAARVNTNFFDKVTYVGAFDGSGTNGDWTCKWAKFAALHNDCFAGHVGTTDIAQYAGDIKVYPTLAPERATLEISLLKTNALQVDIYSLDGRYFGRQVEEMAAAGQNSYALSTASLPNGFYFVRIQVGEGVATEKLIVLR